MENGNVLQPSQDTFHRFGRTRSRTGQLDRCLTLRRSWIVQAYMLSKDQSKNVHEALGKVLIDWPHTPGMVLCRKGTREGGDNREESTYSEFEIKHYSGDRFNAWSGKPMMENRSMAALQKVNESKNRPLGSLQYPGMFR